MNGPGGGRQARIGSWLVLALAAAIIADIVWALVEPLIVPACFVVVAGFVLATIIRWISWRNRR